MADPCPICDRAECQVAVAAERVRAAQDAWDALLKQGGYRAIDAEPPPPEWGALVAASAAYRTAAEDCEAHRADWRARALRAEQERDEAREQAAGNMLAARIEHREAEALRAESRPLPWRREPPTVEEVRRWPLWWQRGTGMHAPESPDLLWLTAAEDRSVKWEAIEPGKAPNDGAVDPQPFGEWLPCIPHAPPPEVVEAAERLLELAGRATEGPWALYDKAGFVAVNCDEKVPVASWQGFDDSDRPKRRHKANAAFIAAARTLAPVVAGWVKEPRR